jgi:hypothetical protein
MVVDLQTDFNTVTFGGWCDDCGLLQAVGACESY